MFYAGIDIGGTYIKAGITDENGVVVAKGQTPSQADDGAERVMDNAIILLKEIAAQNNIDIKNIKALGAGIPGIMDTSKGVVLYNNNLGWRKVKFSDYMSKALKMPVCISNDANIAALGEATYGSGRDYQTSIFITLGTGVGGGIVIDKKIFEGNKGAGAELGHMIIRERGLKCTCGRKGCIESYCSATALIRQTKEAMLKNKDSLLWQACGGNIDNVNGKTAFDVYLNDATALKVINRYTSYLAEGLANFANIFRPEAIILGGGISKQGEELANLLRRKLKLKVYGGKIGPIVELKIAELKNDAGFLGAAELARQKCCK